MAGSALHAALARRADELLGDGEWHNYEKTVKALCRVVPPGVALRTNEQARRGNRRQRGVDPDAPRRPLTNPPGVDDLIASGARTIVRTFLKNKSFETDRPSDRGHDPDRQLRQVYTPRALVGDPYRMQRDKLEYELEVTRDKLDRLTKWVKDSGMTLPDEFLGGDQG